MCKDLLSSVVETDFFELIISNFWATFSWNEQLLGNFWKCLGQLLRDIRATCVKAYFSIVLPIKAQGPEEMCLSLEHQNPSKTSEKMGYFDRVTVSLHIL